MRRRATAAGWTLWLAAFGCGPRVSTGMNGEGSSASSSSSSSPTATTHQTTESASNSDTSADPADSTGTGVSYDPPLALALTGVTTCAVTSAGDMRCWGYPLDPLQKAESAPVLDLGDSPPVAVAGVLGGKCAVLADRTITCWGDNLNGILGYGDLMDHVDLPTGPISVGGAALAVDLSDHGCALLETSEVRCWGLGGDGRVGQGDGFCIGCPDRGSPACCIGDDELPSDWAVVDVGAPAVAVSVGLYVTCILTPDGRVRAWGGGIPGANGLALGDEDIGDDEPPSAAPDVDVGGRAIAVSCDTPSCALLEDGTLRCWGFENVGYAVAEPIGDDETPGSMGAIDVPGPVTQIAAGPGHICAIVEGGDLYCWGYNGSGQLGYGNTDNIGDDETPRSTGPVDIGGAASYVATGEGHTCAVRADGALLCWGGNEQGELGYGHTESIGDDETPASAGPVPWL